MKDCVPPDRLGELRDTFETLVDRQREVWARDRGPDDPPGGVWDTHKQPRVPFGRVADRGTAGAIEFCLHENTLGVASQLRAARPVGLHQRELMCNPVKDHPEGTGWHRDSSPEFDVPLQGLHEAMVANGPGYVQWNIPLYDDDVLWIIPGSHRRPNTEEEDVEVRKDRFKELPGSIAVELKAGDGAVYVNHLLHTGSNYMTNIRRTIHIGYQSFGAPYLRYFHYWWDMGLTTNFPPALREPFEDWNAAIGRQHDSIEAAFRAMLRRDAAGFGDALGGLHTGSQGRLACVVLLSKIAKKIHVMTRTEFTSLPASEREQMIRPRQHHLWDAVAHRFTPEEIDQVWSRFGELDAQLQDEATGSYRPFEMPPAYDVKDFVASWA